MSATSTSTSTSAARIAANQRNAQHSTGPKTAAGKQRSRANAVKHGLTGAGIALPVAAEAAVEERFAAIGAELAPQTVLGVVLVHQVALMNIRLQRAALQETAATASSILWAEADFDEARHTEVDELWRSLATDPIRSRRRLLRMPEGVDRLIDALLDLQADLRHDQVDWSQIADAALDAWFGRSIRLPEGRPSGLAREIRRADATSASRAAAVATLLGWIEAEVAWLDAHRDTLDLEAIEIDRAGATGRALFDPGKTATLARRYEAAANREFFRALREFRAVEAGVDPALLDQPSARLGDVAPPVEVAPPVPPATAPTAPDPKPNDPAEIRASLGSFGRDATAPAIAPARSCSIGHPGAAALGSRRPEPAGLAPIGQFQLA